MPPSGQYNVFELSTATAVSFSTASVVGLTTTSGAQLIDGAGGLAIFSIANLTPDGNNGSRALGVGSIIYNGATYDRVRTPAVFKPFAAVASSSCTVVWTPTAGKKFRLMGFVIGASTLGDVLLQDSTGLVSGTPTTIFRIPAGSNLTPSPVASPPLGNGILSASTANVLSVTGPSTAATLSGTVWGTEE